MDKYIGNTLQVYGVEEVRLCGGKGDGMRLLNVNNGQERLFRFSLPSQSASLISDILNAANFFGLSFLSMNTLPIDKDGASACFNLTFAVKESNLYPFLLYLAMVAPQYTPIGIYSNIKQKGL